MGLDEGEGDIGEKPQRRRTGTSSKVSETSGPTDPIPFRRETDLEDGK